MSVGEVVDPDPYLDAFDVPDVAEQLDVRDEVVDAVDEHPGIDQKPPEVARHPIPDDVIWKRVHERDRNFLLALIGGTGSGKSYAALRLAEVLDPGFDARQVALGLEQFFELVQADFPPGSVVVLDEAGVSASHRDWYDDANQHLNYVLQTWRHQNRIAILTLPELDKLDRAARARLHAFGKMVHLDQTENWSSAQIKKIKVLRGAGGGDLVYPYPRVRRDGVQRMIKGMRFGLPSRDLREQYEARKQAYTAKLNAEALAALNDTQKGDDEVDDPHDVARDILTGPGVEQYLGDNHGQRYVDKDLISLDYDVGDGTAKKVKKLLLREIDDDDVQ
jgi:hypothetical protein